MLFISSQPRAGAGDLYRICVMYSARRGTAPSATSPIRCAILIPRRSSARSPCPAGARPLGPEGDHRANSLCPTNAREAATFGPRCDYFDEGSCDAHAIRMLGCAGGQSVTRPAASAPTVSLDAPMPAAIRGEKRSRAASSSRSDALKKYYEVAASAALRLKGQARGPRPTRPSASRPARARHFAIVGESGCGQVHLRQVLMGSRPPPTGNPARQPQHRDSPSRNRDTCTIADIQ